MDTDAERLQRGHPREYLFGIAVDAVDHPEHGLIPDFQVQHPAVIDVLHLPQPGDERVALAFHVKVGVRHGFLQPPGRVVVREGAQPHRLRQPLAHRLDPAATVLQHRNRLLERRGVDDAADTGPAAHQRGVRRQCVDDRRTIGGQQPRIRFDGRGAHGGREGLVMGPEAGVHALPVL